MYLSTSISALPLIKKSHIPKLKKLGIITIEDLLRHIPSRYEDFSTLKKIANVEPGETVTIEATIDRFSTRRGWKNRKILISEATLSDETGSLQAVWFGQRFLERTLGEGRAVRLSGTVKLNKKGLLLSSPSFESASRTATHTGGITPTYPETEGLTSKWLRWQIHTLLETMQDIPDPIPEDILQELHLPGLRDTFLYIHFPPSENHYQLARKRFAFEEMFLFQLQSLLVRSSLSQEKALEINSSQQKWENILKHIPFALTTDQEKTLQEIRNDITKNKPMNRLLNGDVGSGKSIIAFLALILATQNNHQGVLLAPTEVLAYQHFQSFIKIFAKLDVPFALLTRSYQHTYNSPFEKRGSVKSLSKESLLHQIKSGDIKIIIGTHAVLQETIRFHSLALVIVDEQHRFGVNQRAFLQQRSSELHDGLQETIPHFLTMTATPIPRTLTMTFFGNLDISLLETMPHGRKPIQTKIVPPSHREKIYQFIQSEIEKGQQAFVILPLVEKSKAMEDIKSAIQEREHLQQNVFPNFSIGLVHGKLKSAEKEQVMQDFQDNKYQILVATAVVEVGVDIPNATVMIIEDAQRFGLSQLHQFRGRVGRGDHQSYCFLFCNKRTERLKALEKNNSGFVIAEKDLEIRGPGQFFGTSQSGLPDITMENLTNIRLITIAKNKALEVLESDPTLAHHPLLKKSLEKFEEKIHLE